MAARRYEIFLRVFTNISRLSTANLAHVTGKKKQKKYTAFKQRTKYKFLSFDDALKGYPKIMAHRILDFGEKPAMSNSIFIKLKPCREYSDKGAIYYVTVATVIYILLTNRVKGPYCKLRTPFSSTSIDGPSVKQEGHELKCKKQGAVTYGMD